MNPHPRLALASLGLVLSAAVFAPGRPASAQVKDSFTPMPLDAGFGHMDVTTPSTPPDDIIKQFAAKETEFQDALNHYTYRRMARVQTVDDDTKKVDGEWYQVDDVIFTPTAAALRRPSLRPKALWSA